MVILIIAAIKNLVLVGLAEVMASLYWFIIAGLFLWVLKNEYDELKNQREPHV